MKDLIKKLGETLRLLDPDMDYPFERWSIVIIDPDRIPDLEKKRDHLESLIIRLENTLYRVRDDIEENGVHPDYLKKLCSSIDYLEDTLEFFYSERERLLCESLR